MRPAELVKKLDVSRRQLGRYLKTLFSKGLIVRAGGWKCPYNYIIALPRPLDIRLEHKHTGRARHRYKLQARVITQKY